MSARVLHPVNAVRAEYTCTHSAREHLDVRVPRAYGQPPAPLHLMSNVVLRRHHCLSNCAVVLSSRMHTHAA